MSEVLVEEQEQESSFEDEINDVLGFNDDVETEEPEDEEVANDESGETEEEVVGEEVAEETVVEENSTEVDDVVDEPEDELTTYRAQNAALLARLEKLEGQRLKPAEESVQTPQVVAPKLGEAPQFLTDEDDIDAILGDKAKLNEFAVRIYNKALEASGASVNTRMQNELPGTVVEHVQKHLILREGIDEFFGENKDLLAVRRTVGAITDEVVAEHGDWNLHDVLVEAGKRTREVTGIKVRKEIKRDRNPALAVKAGSRKQSSDRRTAEQKEIDDIL